MATDYILEVQYADDAALTHNMAKGLQQNLVAITDAYRCAGLAINTMKMTAVVIEDCHLFVPLPVFSIQ